MGIQFAYDLSPGEVAANVVGPIINLNAPTVSDTPPKPVVVVTEQPDIRIDLGGHGGQNGQRGKHGVRRTIATGFGLVGALLVVELPMLGKDGACLL